jgi:DNA repair exonuclease SbcCD ATPase subunit
LILRTIRVADWRCFLDDISLGPLADGLNIVHAPNGTGKSTLFEALRRGLLDFHKVTGKDVEAIRPWGRCLAPKVTIEFTDSDQEYRIHKQFLDSPSALLERKEDGKYRRLAEGTAADEKAREILTKTPPGRGLARWENWGLAQILWAPQGGLAIGPLSGDVVSDIRSSLSAQVSESGTGPLEKRIEELYLQFFSVKGKLKAGKDAPLVTRLKEQLEQANETLRAARGIYLAFEETSRRVEELQARRSQARHEADELAKTLRSTRVDAETYRALTAERDQRSERARAAEAQYNEIKQRLDLIKSTETDLDEARKVLDKLEADVPLKEKEVKELEREAALRKADLENVRKDRENVDAAARLAEGARRFHECKRAMGHLDELISKIEIAEKSLTDCRQKRNAHVAPDSKTMKAIRGVIKDRDDAQVRLDASLITLEIVPEEDGIVEVIAGEKLGLVSLNSGVPTQLRGSPEVVADIPHVARVRALGPVGSAEEYRKARERAEQKLKDLTESFATADIDALDALLEKAATLDRSVTEAETKVQTLLSGRTRDEIVREHSTLETTHRAFLGAYPEWEEAPPDTNAVEVEAEKLRVAFVRNVEAAEDSWERTQSALTAAGGQRETLSQRLEDARRQATGLSNRLADLASDGKSMQEREAELRNIAMAWDAARARLIEIQDRLDQYQDDPTAIVQGLEAQHEAVNQESIRAREQEVREEAKLEGLGAQGPYSVLAAAEERVAQLEQEVRAEELRVEAIRLLRDTVTACSTEAIALVAKPVEVAATRTLQRIAGRRLGRVQVGDAFEPAAVVPEMVQQSVTLENLSGGEQEQLYLATRLALAEVLGRAERQLVVLDDVLTATDAGRLARVTNILEEAAQHLQVLILTCHPERYRGLRQAVFFDLEAQVAAGTTCA